MEAVSLAVYRVVHARRHTGGTSLSILLFLGDPFGFCSKSAAYKLPERGRREIFLQSTIGGATAYVTPEQRVITAAARR